MKNNKENKGNKRWLILLFLLLLLNGISFFLFLKNRQEVMSTGQRYNHLQGEHQNLQMDLEKQREALDEIGQENQAYKAEIEKQKGLITIYLDRLAKNDKDLRLLNEVRNKLKQYENLIDSYKSKNQDLIRQNEDLLAQNALLFDQTDALKKENEAIRKRLELVSGLIAYDFKINGLQNKTSGKYLITNKVSKINTLKTCFTVSENALIDAGEKQLFLRILDPKAMILPQESGNFEKISVLSGADLDYSEKRVIDYNNKALEVCIFWNRISDDKLLKGTYIFEIWLEGKRIGSSEAVFK